MAEVWHYAMRCGDSLAWGWPGFSQVRSRTPLRSWKTTAMMYPTAGWYQT